MRTPSIMRTDPVTVTLNPPVLDDAAAVIVYHSLCELVDRFDAHYGEQIYRFYALQDAANSQSPPMTHPEDIPF